MTTTPFPGAPPSEAQGEIVTWSYDPWRERPARAAAAAASAAALGLLVVAARLPFLVGAALAFATVAAFSPALVRVECRLDPDAATRRGPFGTERRRWQDVRRIDDLPAGALLSPYASRHWLDASRALSLPMPAERHAELVSALGRLRGRHGER